MSDLDVNKYRNPNETEKEWQLKRLFIERCHAKFDEDRLLCLAQCYVNIETMGCRYSNEIMKQIGELTADFGPIVKERIDLIMRERLKTRGPAQQTKAAKSGKGAANSSLQMDQKGRQQQQQQQHRQPAPAKQQPGEQAKKKTPGSGEFLPKKPLALGQPHTLLKSTAQPPAPRSLDTPATPNNSLASLNSSSRNGMDFITFIKASMAPAAAAPTQTATSSPAALAKAGKSYLAAAKLGGGSGSANTSLSVPNTTTELAPAPSLVPIPTELASAIRFDLGVSAPIQVPSASTAGAVKSQSVRIHPAALLSSSTEQETQRLLENLSASLPASNVLAGVGSAKKPDPFALLVQSMNSAGRQNGSSGAVPPVLNSLMAVADAPVNGQSLVDDAKFKKLNKINRLREFLRRDFPKQRAKFNQKPPSAAATQAAPANARTQESAENNLINYLRESCDKYDVRLNYVQYHQAEENTYFGELYLESFRFMSGWDKKRKRCCYFAHKKALNLLAGPSELAVKHVQTPSQPDEKRKKLKLESSNAGAGDQAADIDTSYELYQVDGGGGGSGDGGGSAGPDRSGRDIINALMGGAKPVAVAAAVNPNEDLNAMLKSMLIKGGPKARAAAAANGAQITDAAILATSTPATSAAIIKPTASTTASVEANKENEMTLDNSNDSKDGQDDDDADDDDENVKQSSSDRRSKIRAALGAQFCLFLPSDVEQPTGGAAGDLAAVFHEKNAIAVLTNSTSKSHCRLDFEIKTKIKAEQNQSTKSLMSGDRLQSESDEEATTESGVKRKYKCKILINGVKVASGHSKNKVDAKRQACLKACKYLAKFYPLIKESSYAYTSSSSSTNVFKSDENQQPGSKSLDSAPSAASAAAASASSSAVRYFKIPKEALFSTSATTTLLPPTSFESSPSSSATSAAAAAATASLLNILTIKNANSLPPVLTGAASSSMPIYSQFGQRLLAKMGWKGEGFGLGKTQQGIATPIEVDSNAYRFGLGCRIYDEYAEEAAADAADAAGSQQERMDVDGAQPTAASSSSSTNKPAEKASNNSNNSKKAGNSRGGKNKPSQQQQQQQQRPQRPWQTKNLMVNNIRTILANYAHSEAENDLVFEKSLSADDRKLVHQEAHKLGLKTRSQGVEPNRFIVVCKKRTSAEIYEAMLKNGGQSSKFQLLSAGTDFVQPPPQ